jgi:Mu transposase-like protein
VVSFFIELAPWYIYGIRPAQHNSQTKFNPELGLIEINQAIAIQRQLLNERPMQRINLSRQQQFEQFEKSALRPLPLHRFELQEWKKAKVHIDYHICILKHFYSVPHRFVGQRVEVCITKSRIEVFHQSQRIALHPRDDTPHRFTTLTEHMPPKHQHYQQELNDMSIASLLAWAKSVGPHTLACVDKFFQVRAFPQQAIRAILGLKRLANRFGNERFENACQQTLELHRYRLQTVEAILKHDLDKKALPKKSTTSKILKCPEHFRGSHYYK